MSNRTYNKQTSVGNSRSAGESWKQTPGGGPGAEHDAAHKDTVTKWLKAPGATRSITRAGATEIKVAVISDGVAQGGNDHFSKR